MKREPKIGHLIEDGDRTRDAIHVAIAPGKASERLVPGQHIGFTHPTSFESFGPSDETVGIVDPFLKESVEPGERFWVFLYPGTIESLRHVWTHPEFARRRYENE